MKHLNSWILVIMLFLTSCEDDNEVPKGGGSTFDSDDSGRDPSAWLIPEKEVYDGGPGKDGIPAVGNPEFISVDEANWLEPDDLVIGIKSGNVIKAYPHIILDWHEIVNDEIGNRKIAVTYCPLTGTGIGWNRTINGEETTFGVSGLLYNTNLIPYDRKTDSYWSQIKLQCVNGELSGTDINTFHMVETNWETWSEMYPGSEIMSLNTGYSRSYGLYPYGGYQDSDALVFPVKPLDNRINMKERVLGVIIENNAMLFRFDSFDDENGNIIQENFREMPLVVVGNKAENYIVAYINNNNLSFSMSEDASKGVFKDNKNNYYNLFGEVINGPDAGTKLEPTTSFMGYAFSFGAFYPTPNIYGF